MNQIITDSVSKSDDMVNMTVRISRDKHRYLKVRAASLGVTVQSVVSAIVGAAIREDDEDAKEFADA